MIYKELLLFMENSLFGGSIKLKETQEYLEKIEGSVQCEGLFLALARMIENQSLSPLLRMQAGLQLKKLIYSNEAEQRGIKSTRWLSLDAKTREEVKKRCFSAMGTEHQDFDPASLCIAYIACVEIPVNKWPGVIRMLVKNFTEEEATGSLQNCYLKAIRIKKVVATERLKHASLKVLRIIFHEIDSVILASQADEILTGFVCDLKEENRSTYVKKEAVIGLLYFLEFARYHFSKKDKRDEIMSVVLKTIEGPDTEIAVIGLQCLENIVCHYYCHMGEYMDEYLLNITFKAMKHTNHDIVFEGISFWITVCLDELDMAAEKFHERGNLGEPILANRSNNYARGAVKKLVPILLDLMARQEEGDDDEYDEYESDPHKRASICLSLLAKTSKEMILELVVPYVQANINHEDWRLRNAAVMAFGSILEGPPRMSVEPLAYQTMTMIIVHLLKDNSPVVCETAAWTTGRICEVLPEVPLNDLFLPSLLHTMVIALTSEARIATKICWALGSLAKGAFNLANTNDVPQSYKLSSHFINLANNLFATANRPDYSLTNFRKAAYTALMELTKSAPQDCYGCIQWMTISVLDKLFYFLNVQYGSLDTRDKVQLDEFQSLLCGTLQSVLRKLTKEDVLVISAKVMLVLIPMFQRAQAVGKSSGYSRVQEDALLAVSALIDSIGTHFNNYLPEFMKVLIPCLTNVNEHQICENAIGVIGDLTRNKLNIEPYLPTVFQYMDSILRNPGTQRSLLPLIISTYGDFALLLGDVFIPYLSFVFTSLQQIWEVKFDLNDPDLNSLRGSCIDAFVSIIQVGRAATVVENVKRLALIIPHIDFIIKFVEHVGAQTITSDELLGSCCKLVGDIITAFGKDSLVILNTDGINNLLNKACSYKNASTKKYALWALKEMKKLKEAPVL